jgi:hypothetical protein
MRDYNQSFRGKVLFSEACPFSKFINDSVAFGVQNAHN